MLEGPGAAKGAKPQLKSPAKAQAHMLWTSRRSSDSDKKLLYERAYLVRPREDIKQRTEPMDKDLDQDVDSPFSMSQIKSSVMDEESARERANLVQTRLEPEMQAVQSGLTKSDLIMVEPDIVTSCTVAEPKVWEIEERKKAKHVEHAMAIVSTDDCRVARFGKIPGNRPRILWREDGSMFSTSKGILYLPVENEYELPLDMQKLEPFERDAVPEHRRWQRGRCPEAIREDSKMIQRELYGWCVVIEGYIHPITDFLRGQLCKPSLEVQARAAFTSLCETYDEDVHQRTIKSLEENEHMQYLRTMVCLKIASVVPDESNDRKQEMWIIQASNRHEIGVYCSRNEWKQVQQSYEHAKEC